MIALSGRFQWRLACLIIIDWVQKLFPKSFLVIFDCRWRRVGDARRSLTGEFVSEDLLRDLIAQNVANTIVVEALLRMLLRDRPKQCHAIAEAIINVSRRTDWLSGIAIGDDASAERLADITVLMQKHVARIVDSAVATVGNLGR
jgi:hypothetical protein